MISVSMGRSHTDLLKEKSCEFRGQTDELLQCRNVVNMTHFLGGVILITFNLQLIRNYLHWSLTH